LLTVDYGISRTPLREALKVLAAEGLVTLKPRRGCFVTEISEQDLDEIFPLMAMLEGRCALEATRRAQPEQIARLETIHRQLERFAAAIRSSASSWRIRSFTHASSSFPETAGYNR
jgi:DNA-binding GntR family transcriptional regulator